MPQERETHLFTERGALCGAATPYHWSLSEARVTCAGCRSQFEARAEERRAALLDHPFAKLARFTAGG